MNILISLDDAYIDYHLVTLYSLMKNNEEMMIYVFHTDNLCKKNILKIKKLAEKLGSSVRDININIKGILDLPNKGWPIEAWLRHLALSILPQDMDRILYLDGDIIVNDSIISFYNMDMKNNCYVAAMDRPLNGKCEDNKDQIRLAELGMQKEDIYVNSGVLLINISQLRSEGYKQEDYWVYARKIRDSIMYPDQDVLNGMFSGKILVCDDAVYNCQINTYSFEDTKRYLKRAKIIHYTSFRPWEVGYKRVSAGLLWWKYALQIESKFLGKCMCWLCCTLPIVIPWHIARKIKTYLVRKLGL